MQQFMFSSLRWAQLLSLAIIKEIRILQSTESTQAQTELVVAKLKFFGALQLQLSRFGNALDFWPF